MLGAILNGKGTARNGTGTSTPVHTATTRPLVLLHPSSQTRVSLHVPSTSQEWIAAEVARDTFQDWLHAAEKNGNLVGFEAAEIDDEQAEGDEAYDEMELVLTSYFLTHVAGLLPFPQTATSPSTAAVLLAAFNHFSATFLHGTDIHTLAATLPAPVRALVISSYFLAKTKLQVEGLGKVLPRQSESALLQKVSSGQAELYALFGGQGMNEVYFDELQVRCCSWSSDCQKEGNADAILRTNYRRSSTFTARFSPLSSLSLPNTSPLSPPLRNTLSSMTLA